MYKELYKTAVLLLFKPSEAWKALTDKKMEDEEVFLSRFLYPFAGLITLAAFIGIFFTRENFDLEVALKSAIIALVSTLCGFFAAAYLINMLMEKWLKYGSNLKLSRRFVGYSSVVVFVLNIVLSLLSGLGLLRFLVLYTLYIVWEGASPYMEIREGDIQRFSIAATLLIILAPIVVEMALYMLMPGLRI